MVVWGLWAWGLGWWLHSLSGSFEAKVSGRIKAAILTIRADAVRINRAEFFRSPRLRLQRTIWVYLAAAFLVFVIQGFNTCYRESHHGLVADLSRESLIVHARDVEMGISAADTCIGRRSAVAESFLEAADICPPLQRLRRVGGRQNGNSAFNDRFH